MLSPVLIISMSATTDPLLSRIIHAKKMQRNDLDANCRFLEAFFRGQEKDCEADEVKNLCETKRNEINIQIGFYRKLRGDRRKFFTRIWHSIKRAGSNFWHRIGPIGRRFLRNVGDDALQMAVSGGLSSSTLKNLIKHQVKSMGRKRIKEIVFQGVQRLLQGQLDIAAAAGVDICDDEEDQIQDESEQKEDEKNTGDEFKLPDSGVWDLSCQDQDEFRDKYYQTVIWKVTINWKARAFEGMINAQRDQIWVTEGYQGQPDIVEKEHLDWKEIGRGTVSEDGFFWGDFAQVITTTFTHGEGKPNITSREST